MKLFLCWFILIFSIAAGAQPSKPEKQELSGPAPELKTQKGWLNTDKPLTLSDLKGKIVLLDFWTYGCINCIHVIPDLKRLEAKYEKELVVIGVHSGLFTNEKDTENIRHIILRYGLEHPIVNDSDFRIWKAYKVRVYPTQVVIDPNGDVVATTTSEGQLGLLNKIIGETAAKFRTSGTLNEKPMTFALERDRHTDGPLAFPGKVLADAKSNRLFIADTGHNRIVVADLEGKLIEIVGSGQAGRQDGDFTTASFYRPQGLAIDGDMLYVADTSNQLIRRIDLISKKVVTVAGNGYQGRPEAGGPAATTMLNSPWDLVVVGRQLFIAMAGNHQVWVMDLDQKTIGPSVGTGAEGRKDGTFETATFAQPSGLAYDGKNLYVADPESNRLRALDLTARTVKTLPNTDVDPELQTDELIQPERLQHPAGIAVFGKNLVIADTYNHQIKQINPAKGFVKTLFGDGKYGPLDGKKIRFYEPGGISAAGEKLYVADTNNHSIRVIDLNGKEVRTLTITGLQKPILKSETEMKKFTKYIVIVLWAAISFVAFSVSQSAAESVPYPTGYRSWVHVKSEIVGKDSPKFKKYEGIHHIYANSKAMEGFENGAFPDGSVIVFDLLETQVNNGITREGSRRFIDVMHKDSKKFAKTAGWGFEEFNGNSTTERLLTEENAVSCSACHASQKDHVFSNFRK